VIKLRWRPSYPERILSHPATVSDALVCSDSGLVFDLDEDGDATTIL
jgi:hypothetical protein